MMKPTALLAAALALLLGGCATAQTQPSPAPAKAAELFAPIPRLIGDARCTSDAQCRTVGVGHKPCGGPGSYLAWSTASTTDEAGLRQAVERHAQAQREEQERSGMLSNCMAVRDPGARCVASTCKLNGSPGAGAQ